MAPRSPSLALPSSPFRELRVFEGGRYFFPFLSFFKSRTHRRRDNRFRGRHPSPPACIGSLRKYYFLLFLPPSPFFSFQRNDSVESHNGKPIRSYLGGFPFPLFFSFSIRAGSVRGAASIFQKVRPGTFFSLSPPPPMACH